jgi:hypothetical protein
MLSMQDTARVVLIGAGATAVMDLWLLLLQRVGVPTTNFALIGRWVGHLARGRVAHSTISTSPAITGERALGWLTHYAVGVAYAGLLIALQGLGWMREPTFLPALAFGVATVAMPLFVMQPAMGAGIAGTKTPSPAANVLRSLANHAVFGSGLFVTAALLASVCSR